MKLTEYAKSHAVGLFCQIALIGMTDAMFFASGSMAEWLPDFGYLNLLYLVVLILGNGCGWLRERQKYAPLQKALRDGTPVTGLIPDENRFYPGLMRNLQEADDARWSGQYWALRRNADEMKDYINLWTHEIKLPLSVMELMLDNADRPIDRLRPELERMKFLVNQVLFVGRVTHYAEDLVIQPFSLEMAVRAGIRSNAAFLIGKNIGIETENLDFQIVGDMKWTIYILEQILNNASKYVSSGGLITLRAVREDRGILLLIRDNGIGIPPGDIGRIFDKGFTGENGRRYGRSTGMGLHYAKRMADRLEIGLEADSRQGEFTEFRMVFFRLGDWYEPGRPCDENVTQRGHDVT